MKNTAKRSVILTVLVVLTIAYIIDLIVGLSNGEMINWAQYSIIFSSLTLGYANLVLNKGKKMK